jgi:putative endonuclease
MAIHNELGKEAEKMAEKYLKENDFEILEKNWRYSRYEIDFIAKKNGLLHIIEVKARNFSPAGYPEESVKKKKFRYLVNAADDYLYRHPEYKHIQFNILAITMFTDKEPEFFLIEDVFL